MGCIRLFIGVFFSTGIPTSSYFLAASNRGWEARRPDPARKLARNGAGRLGGLWVFSTGIHTSSFYMRLRTGAGRPAGPIARMGAGMLGGLIQLV